MPAENPRRRHVLAALATAGSAGCLGFLPDDASEPETGMPPTTNSQTETTRRPTTDTPTPPAGTETLGSPAQQYSFGETFEGPDWDVTVTDLAFADHYTYDGERRQPPEDEKLAIATVTVEDNTGSWTSACFAFLVGDAVKPSWTNLPGDLNDAAASIPGVEHKRQVYPSNYRVGPDETGTLWAVTLVDVDTQVSDVTVAYDCFREERYDVAWPIRWVPEGGG